MKTAMQQAVERLKIAHPKKITNEWGEGYMQGLEVASDILKDLIPTTEKQQLEDAWNDGNESVDGHDGITTHSFTDYYSKTYNNE